MSGPDRVGELCRSCVRSTGADGAGVALVSSYGVREVLFVTDPVAEAIEAAQLSLGEGPCIDAAVSRAPVLVSDLADPSEKAGARWPFFTADMGLHGVRGLFAFPIRLGSVAVATLELYRRRPGGLRAPEIGEATAAVEDIGGTLLGGDAPDDRATAPSVQVHQAAGMVMVQLDVSAAEALAVLRATAFAEGVPLSDLARDVVLRRRRLSGELDA